MRWKYVLKTRYIQILLLNLSCVFLEIMFKNADLIFFF